MGRRWGGGLAEEVRLQADPRQDVFWHTENGIHRFDLLVAEKRETRDAKKCVEGINLQRKGVRSSRWCKMSSQNAACHTTLAHSAVKTLYPLPYLTDFFYFFIFFLHS